MAEERPKPPVLPLPYRAPPAEDPSPDVATRLGAPCSTLRPPPVVWTVAAVLVAVPALVVAYFLLVIPGVTPVFWLLPVFWVLGFGAAIVRPYLRLRGFCVDIFAGGVVVSRGTERDVVIFEDVARAPAADPQPLLLPPDRGRASLRST